MYIYVCVYECVHVHIFLLCKWSYIILSLLNHLFLTSIFINVYILKLFSDLLSSVMEWYEMSPSYRQLTSFQYPIVHSLAIAFIPPGWVQTQSRMSTKGRNHHLILDNGPNILQGTRKWPD